MEEQFPTTLSIAEWVPEAEARHAISAYEGFHAKWRQGEEDPDIVPYWVRLKALVYLMKDPDLKKFWTQVEKIRPDQSSIISAILGLFLHFFGNRSIIPKITLKERDKSLNDAASYLKKMISELYSDSSTIDCFELGAFQDAMNAGGLKPDDAGYNVRRFMDSLHESLSSKNPDGCRKMKTHHNLPISIREDEGRKAERVRFIHSVSRHIEQIFQKPNHALTARILNGIRPDLGCFLAANIRLQYKKRNA